MNRTVSEEEARFVRDNFFSGSQETYDRFVRDPNSALLYQLKDIVRYFRDHGRLVSLAGNKPHFVRRIQEIYGVATTEDGEDGDDSHHSHHHHHRTRYHHSDGQSGRQEVHEYYSSVPVVPPATVPVPGARIAAPATATSSVNLATAIKETVAELTRRVVSIQQHQPWQQPAAIVVGNFLGNITDSFHMASFFERQDPFAKIERRIIAYGFGTPGMTVRLPFRVDLELASALRNREKSVQLRLFDPAAGADLELLASAELVVSGMAFTLPVLPRKRARSRARNPVVTSRAADISNYMRVGENSVQFRQPVSTRACIAVVQAVTWLSVPVLLASVPRASSAPRAERDAEISMQESKMPLQCPLSLCRITVPAKGRACSHQRCFDLRAFLEYSRQAGLWECPVCNSGCPFSSLVIDEWFERALSVAQEGDTFVTVGSDGSVRRSTPTPAVSPVSHSSFVPAHRPSSSRPVVEVVNLESDEDEEDEEDDEEEEDTADTGVIVRGSATPQPSQQATQSTTVSSPISQTLPSSAEPSATFVVPQAQPVGQQSRRATGGMSDPIVLDDDDEQDEEMENDEDDEEMEDEELEDDDDEDEEYEGSSDDMMDREEDEDEAESDEAGAPIRVPAQPIVSVPQQPPPPAPSHTLQPPVPTTIPAATPRVVVVISRNLQSKSPSQPPH